MHRSVAVSCLLLLAALAPAARAQEGNARAEAIAREAAPGKAALAWLTARVQEIRNPVIREATLSLLANPVPTFMALYPDAQAREAVRAELVAAGLLDASVPVEVLFPALPDPKRAPLSFLAAAGGSDDGHHAYPGGLAEHTAFNVRAALALLAGYREQYGIGTLDRDVVIAAPALHDVLKAWVMQWRADGTLLVQAKVAGTASHHPFGVAEAIHRKLPPRLIVALASAHEPPGLAPERVVAFLRAGAILAKQDPVALGLLRAPATEGGPLRLPEDQPGFEATINHLSDHDYVLADPAAKRLAEAMTRVLRAAPEGKALHDAELRWTRLAVQARKSGLALYGALLAGGDAGLTKAMGRVPRPVGR
jgi:hypothetical protein